MTALQRHPFPVVARFDRVVALSFAFPEDALTPLVPPGLEMDAYDGNGFLTVALVWTRGLRPAGFPAFTGRDFFLAGYRIFTRLRTASGRNLRGLRILRTETDRRGMVFAGNLMTGYNYRHVRVRTSEVEGETRLVVTSGDGIRTLDLAFSAQTESAGLPPDSPFPDWRTARRFAGPMPFTFSPQADGSFMVIEGRRAGWQPQPVTVRKAVVAMFDESALAGVVPRLANAFSIENVDYRWERGVIMNPADTP